MVSELKVVSDDIFTKYKGSVLSCEEFAAFVEKNDDGNAAFTDKAAIIAEQIGRYGCFVFMIFVISLLKRLKNFSECESGFRRAVDLSYIEFLQLIIFAIS